MELESRNNSRKSEGAADPQDIDHVAATSNYGTMVVDKAKDVGGGGGGSAKENICPSSSWGSRHTFALLSCLGMANVYAMRVNLSVAIVAMVGGASHVGNRTDVGMECPPLQDGQGEEMLKDEVHFDWDPGEQGLVLGAFFYGYIATQLPGGMWAERRGGKWLFGLGVLCTSALTLLSPFAAARGGKWAFAAVRTAEGLGEGVTFPAMQVMIATWTPLGERSRLGSLIFSGCQLGTVAALSASGWLAQRLGWQWVFYAFGIAGCLWFVFWALLVYDSPAKHPCISKEERRYIESNLVNPSSHLPMPPFAKIMTSPPFLALIAAHVGQNWGLYTLLTEVPTYLSNIQHFSLTEDGVMSALPYLLMWLSSFPFGFASDFLIRTGTLTFTGARKALNSVAMVGPALGLVWLSFVGCDHVMAILALCLSVGLNGGTYAGFQINHVDLSPNYAGTLMAITNTFANFCGFLAPYAAGAITTGNQTFAAWRTVFLVASAVYVTFNGIFVAFGSAEVQPWNTYWERDAQEGEENATRETKGDDGSHETSAQT